MTTYKAEATRLAVLSIGVGVGALFIAIFASYAFPDFANAQSFNLFMYGSWILSLNVSSS
jgi:hypothetical protein